MEEVTVRQTFPHAAAKVWQITGDFGGLKNWLPGVVSCTVQGEGALAAGVAHAAFANARALHDPFVGSFDESREVVIIYSALWNGVA